MAADLIMPSMMAIVSKAVFEKAARGKSLGDTWSTDRYASSNKALAQLAGGSLYLVTVRPPNEALWLVAVLERPRFETTQWTARANTRPIRDISNLKARLRFANGQGLPDKAGTLGMSLQTPRVLTDEDLALLTNEDAAEEDKDATDIEGKDATDIDDEDAADVEDGADDDTTDIEGKDATDIEGKDAPGVEDAADVEDGADVEGDDTTDIEDEDAADVEGKDATEIAARARPTTSRSAAASTAVVVSTAAAGPSTARRAATPPRPSTSPVLASDDGLLAQALEVLHAGNCETALGLLIGAWETCPHPRLAEIIAALSAETRTATPPNLRGKTAAARAAWDEHSSNARAVDLPMLLESLVDVSSGDAIERLPIVEGWMPDPRVDATFVDILDAVPYRATSTQKFWRRLFPLMREIRDPAQLARIEALRFADVAATMAAWLEDQRGKLVAVLKPKVVEVVAPRILDDIAVVVGRKRVEGAAEREGIEHLFRAVYESPADDGLRTVLADALIERNDPRGELINLQLRADMTDRAARARERELLDAHAKQWLGDLAPILKADFKFERGFLAACKVDSDAFDRIRKLVGNPVWSTVHTIEGSAAIALDPVMRSLRTLGFSQVASRREQLPDAWRDLLVQTERPIEELRYEGFHRERQWFDTAEGRRQVDVSDSSELDALCVAAALPKLRRLTIRDTPILYIGKLATAPVLDRLEQLGFIYDRNNRFDVLRASPLVDFANLLREARVPALRFEIGSFHETLLELERGTTGYQRARMTLGPTMKSNWSHQLVDEAMRMLDVLPNLRELRITTRKHTETQQVARLRAAATQMKLDVSDVG